MRNYYFVRYLTSSIILSLFTSNLWISTAKTVNAEDKAVSQIQKKDCSIPTQFVSPKLRIAVADFTIVATSLNSRSLSSNAEEVKRIADIIASKLATYSNFVVIERTQIEPIYKKKGRT